MTFNLIEEHFYQLLELESESRERYLIDLSQEDPSLATELRELLDCSEDTETFLDQAILTGPSHPLRRLVEWFDFKTEMPENIGSYKVLELLGYGGMGIVYRVRGQDFGNEAALKVLHPNTLDQRLLGRFVQECRILASLKHENIAHFINANVEENTPYLVMEYVSGEDVYSHCDQHTLTLSARLEVFHQICEGVIEAHNKGVIHGDLKPKNILASKTGEMPTRIKIIDFGIAQGVSRYSSGLYIFGKHSLLFGSPMYMSPEQLLFDGDTTESADWSLTMDTRSDCYALGLILFELITGESARDLTPGTHTLKNILQANIKCFENTFTKERANALGVTGSFLKSDFQKELGWILNKVLHPNIQHRYESVRAFADDISALLNSKPVSAVPKGKKLYPFMKWVERHRMATLAATSLAFGIVLAFIGLTFAWQREVDARMALEKVKQTHDFYNDLVETPQPNAMGPNVRFVDVLISWEQQIKVSTDVDDILKADLYFSIGKSYFGVGLYERALKHFTTVYQLRNKRFGPFDDRTLGALERRAYAEFLVGQTEQARVQFEDILQTATIDSSIYHSALRGLLALEIASNQEPSRQIKERLEAYLGEYQPPPQQIEATKVVLAEYYKEVGNFEDSEALLKEVYVGQVKKFGSSHPTPLLTGYNLATLYLEQRKFTEALDLYESIYIKRVEALGNLHPYTLQTLHGKVQALRLAGALEQALKEAQSLFDAYRIAHGDLDRETLNIGVTLLSLKGLLNGPENVINDYDNLVSLFEKAGLLESSAGLRALNDQAHFLNEAGRPHEALKVIENCITKKANLDPSKEESLFKSLSTKGEILMRLGQQDQALKIYESIYEATKTSKYYSLDLIRKYGSKLTKLLAMQERYDRLLEVSRELEIILSEKPLVRENLESVLKKDP